MACSEMSEDAGDIKSAYDLFMQSAMVEKNLEELKSVCSETSDSISQYLSNTGAIYEDYNRCLRALSNRSEQIANFISRLDKCIELMRFSHCQDYARICLKMSGKNLADKLTSAFCRPREMEIKCTIKQFINLIESGIYSSKYTYHSRCSMDSRLKITCHSKKDKDGFNMEWEWRGHFPYSVTNVKICLQQGEIIYRANRGMLEDYDEDLLKKLIINHHNFFEELLMAQAIWEARL